MSDANLALLLTPLQLKDAIEQRPRNSIIVVDLSSDENYQRGHIEGALHFPSGQLISGVKPAPGQLPSLEALQASLAALGFDGSQHLVAYDDQGGPWAGRFIWTLNLFGFENVSFLDGGIAAWLEAGFSTSQDVTKIDASQLQLEFKAPLLAQQADVEASLDNADSAIWDARSPEEYSGEKVLAARGGHIPGAINYDWVKLHRSGDAAKRLRPLAEIQGELNQLGLSADKNIITHCQTHRRSGLTYLVAKALGYQNVQAYPGSWSQWGNDQNTQITTGETP